MAGEASRPSRSRTVSWAYPVTEIRGALLRPFLEERMSIAANFLIAQGYTGQTIETLAYPVGTEAVDQVVGVPLKSYVSLSWTYYFKSKYAGQFWGHG